MLVKGPDEWDRFQNIRKWYCYWYVSLRIYNWWDSLPNSTHPSLFIFICTSVRTALHMKNSEFLNERKSAFDYPSNATLLTLFHYGIYSILSVDGGEGTRFFIEMEYCEKGDLETMIENRNGERFSQDEVSKTKHWHTRLLEFGKEHSYALVTELMSREIRVSITRYCKNSRWPCHHDDVIKWKHFPRYWPFVRGIHRSPVNSPHKGQWRGALMFPLICARINRWVNNRKAGD